MPEWEELQLFELEEPAKRPSKAAKSRRQQYGTPIPAATTQEIWEHYLNIHGSRGRQPRLSPERVQLITFAVNEYGKQGTLDAITGCSLSEWHMGGNPAGRKYNSLELILRDGAHIERFLQLTVVEDTKGGFLDD